MSVIEDFKKILEKIRGNSVAEVAGPVAKVASDDSSLAPGTQPPVPELAVSEPMVEVKPVPAGLIRDPLSELRAQSSDKLMLDDYKAVAERLGCSWEAVAAVAHVESGSLGGFDPNTRLPIILYERHLFSRKTGGKFDASHPMLSSPRAGGYAKSQWGQWSRLAEAFQLVPEAALESTSWGRFQILGQNWHRYPEMRSVHGFVRKLARSEKDQLDAFENFIVTNKLADELQRLDWAGFASRYNGPGYRANRYDEKMATAYKQIQRQEL